MYFMSLNQLKGLSPTRRDDLESMFYTLVFLAKDTLPWLKDPHILLDYFTVTKLKKTVTTEELCKGLPTSCKNIW